MRSGKWILVLVLCLVPSMAFAQLWTNKPSGLTVISDCPFSGALCPGWQNIYNTQAYASSSNAPVSPPSVFDTFLGAFSTTGNGQWIYPLPNVREVYVGTYWAQNADFEGMGDIANKMIFVQPSGEANFLNWIQGGRWTPGVLTWVFQQNGGINNCHVSGYISPGCSLGPEFGPGTGNLTPNVAAPSIAAGSGWHKIEIYQRASTSATSRDGIIRIWVDGLLSTDYSNLNLGPNGFIDFQINHTWDGGPRNDCPARDCTRAWHHYWDHMVIATGNGGGSTSPPPPSPTPPPPTGTPGTVSDLTVVPQSSTTALVSFTQQNDGTGVPATYDNRLSVAPMSWGSATGVSSGPCASPFAPSGLIGSTVTCLLSGLTPGQSYQLQNVAFRGTMNQGATYGSLGNIASFTMPSSNVPTLNNFAPASGTIGTSVTISGTNFGATVGANTVKFNGQVGTVTSASPTSLTVTAPDGVTTGKISVQTDQGLVYSDQNFTVGASGNGCGCS